MNSFSKVGDYLIIDLEETLELSSTYLAKVLSIENHKKLRFMTPTQCNSLDLEFDLLIQIDGFQEMEATVIDHYYSKVVPLATWVFLSNPVGKYLPDIAGLTTVDSSTLDTVLNLGKSRTMVDPWDSESLDSARSVHIENYRPRNFKILQTQPSRLRPLYQNVIYEKLRDEA